MFNIIKAGIQVTVQDYPGRVGYAHLGFPRSGPMDSFAFRFGNLLVGNSQSEAGIEFAFKGPQIEFSKECLISVTGADSAPTLNGEDIPMWTAIKVDKGSLLDAGVVKDGVWGYICVSGGINVPEVMGSKSTFTRVKLGGFEGRELRPGDTLNIGNFDKEVFSRYEGRKLKKELIPVYSETKTVELMLGNHYDWLSEKDIEMVYSTVWNVLINQSNRLGYRLQGPEFEFSEKAVNKPRQCGVHPSNTYDTGYCVGGINLAGQTPIVLTVDGPTAGGYISPFVVASESLWKVSQSRAGIRFKHTTVVEAKKLRDNMRAILSLDSLES